MLLIWKWIFILVHLAWKYSFWNWEMAYPYSFIYFSLPFHLFIYLCFMHVFNLCVIFFENVYTCIEAEIIKSKMRERRQKTHWLAVITESPHARESKAVLDSGFNAAYSGFQELDSQQSWSVELEFWIAIVSGIRDSLSCIPDSTSTIFLFFSTMKNFLHSLTWGQLK